jgi:hypothetical protein
MGGIMPEVLSSATASDLFKISIAIVVSGFMPVTAYSFLWVRRIKKENEFARLVALLGIARDKAEFARDRVTEQYAKRDYVLPVTFCWTLSILGLTSLLFGQDLVGGHPGKENTLLTGLYVSDDLNKMQVIRRQNMVLLSIGFLGAFL